jgi:cell division septum initiation protein DivIVA
MLGIDLTLSLSREAMMAHHRQRAARMNRNDLAQLADELIQRAHQQEHLIMELQRAAADLMVEIEAMKPAEGPPGFAPVRDRHLEWARELRQRMP